MSTAYGEVACPLCGSSDTELVSPFGSHLLVSQHLCHACRTYFEAVRDDRREEPAVFQEDGL